MKDTTKNIERAFEYVRKFYNEIAQMVSDIMELMSKKGWESPGGPITADLSYSLDNPDKWMVFYVYKNFLNKKINTHIMSIVTYLNNYMNDFPISIVCGKINQPRKSYNKYGLWWLIYYNSDELAKLTGEVISLSTVYKGEAISGDIFAIPLSQIQTPEDVRDKIVKRILEL